MTDETIIVETFVIFGTPYEGICEKFPGFNYGNENVVL